MPDLSMLSTEDLQALQSGDLSKVSTAGLKALQGMSAAPAPTPSRTNMLPRLPNGQVDPNSTDFKIRAAQDLGEFQKEVDPNKDYNYIQRLGMSGSAGLSDVWQGLQQRLGNATPEDVAEKRRIDERLTEGTAGGGVAKFLGNAAPLAAVGLIPGMQGIAGGAALGAAGGALTPTGEGESAFTNTLLGAGLGAAIPGGAKVLKSVAGRLTGRTAANKVAERLVSQAETQAAPQVDRTVMQRLTGRGDMTEEQRVAQAIAQRLRTVQPTHVAGVRQPLSVGEVLDDAGITRIEQGSRVSDIPEWVDFLRRQQQARADALRASTAGADQLDSLASRRSNAYEIGMKDAMANAKADAFHPELQQLLDAIEGGRVSPDSMLPGVQELYQGAATRLASAGETISPEHLLKFRTGLNQGFSSPNARLSGKDVNVMNLKEAFDTTLDKLTGGRVTPVTREFADASKAVDAAEAAGNVRSKFFTPEGRPATRVVFGDTPEINEARLREAIKQQAREKRFGGGSYLAEQTNEELNSLLDVIRKQSKIQQLNQMATPGGSATEANKYAVFAKDQAANVFRNQLEKIGTVGKVATGAWDVIAKGGEEQAKAMLARATQDPVLMAHLMEQYAKSLGPSATQTAVVNALRASGQAGLSSH